MANSLNREELIQLLSTLGAENDEVVLSAAREIDSKINEAGTNWDDLLLPEPDTESSHAVSDEPESSSGPKTPPPDDQESLRLIESLLAKSDLSEDMREELEMYRDDINEGDFTDMDRKYVQSLHDRLAKA
jgi:hypothetical protein